MALVASIYWILYCYLEGVGEMALVASIYWILYCYLEGVGEMALVASICWILCCYLEGVGEMALTSLSLPVASICSILWPPNRWMKVEMSSLDCSSHLCSLSFIPVRISSTCRKEPMNSSVSVRIWVSPSYRISE